MSTAAPLITYDAFSTKVKDRVFPFGVPENLDLVVDQFIVEALVLIQRYAAGYQAHHVDVVDSTFGTFPACGSTILAKPRGKIIRLVNRLKDDATVDGDEACDWFAYDRVTREDLEATSRVFVDVDLTDCRILWGNYSEQRGNIAVVPPIRAAEKIELTWSGIKREYADGDLVPDDPELLRAVALYVEKENAARYDKDTESAKSAAEAFAEALAEIILDDQSIGIHMYDPLIGAVSASLSFDSFALARAHLLPFADNQVVVLLGESVPSDGGEGVFYFDATSVAADDGATVLKPDNIAVADPGRLIRLIL